MATVALPSPGTPLTLHGQLQAGKVVFDGPKRFLLSADATEALRVCWGGGTYVLLTHGVPCVTLNISILVHISGSSGGRQAFSGRGCALHSE